jgi:hypothetical protein
MYTPARKSVQSKAKDIQVVKKQEKRKSSKRSSKNM